MVLKLICSLAGETPRFTISLKSPDSSANVLPPHFPPMSRIHTWVVSAASSSAASPPLPVIERGAPLLQPSVLQRVGCQVADLQTRELTQEVVERHPERQR